MEEMSNGVDTSRQHLGHFLRSLDQLKPPLEAISELAKHEKVDGRSSWTTAECSRELIYWIQLYLTHLGCPLEYCIPCARAIVNNVLDSQDFHMADFEAPPPQLAAMDSNDTEETWKQLNSLNGTNGHEENGTTLNGDNNNKESAHGPVISAKNLYGHAVQKANEILTRWKDDLPHFEPITAPHRVSAYAIKNKRPGMEDRHVIIPDLRSIVDLKGIKSPVSFYAVYDGHAGAVAAAYAAAHLHHSLCASPHYPDQMEKALKEAFVTTDEQYEMKGIRDKDYSGTTAVVSVVYERKLYIAWVGDSEAAIIVNGHADKLVEPRHTAENEVERKRVQDDGGTVIVNQGGWRVGAVLTVTRAIGDSGFKPFVTSNPDVRSIDLDGSEDYLILACDGLWDEMTPQDAMNITNRYLFRNPTSPDDVAKELADKAKRSGSLDNISVLVVFLQPYEQLVHKLQVQREEQRDKMVTPPVDEDDFADLVDVSTNVDFVVDYESQQNHNPFDTTPLDSSVLGDFGTPSDRSASEVDWDFERVPVNQYREEESQALNFLDEAIVGLELPTSPSSHKPSSVTPTEDVRREFARDEEGRPIVITHDGQEEEQGNLQEQQHSEAEDHLPGRSSDEGGRPAQEKKVEASLEQDYAEFQHRSSSQTDQLLTDQDSLAPQNCQSNQPDRNNDSFERRLTELQSTVESNPVSAPDSAVQADDLTAQLGQLQVAGEPNSGSAPMPSTNQQSPQSGTNMIADAIVAAAAGLGTAVGFVQSALNPTTAASRKTPTKTPTSSTSATKKTPHSPATPTSASSRRTPSNSSKSTNTASSASSPSKPSPSQATARKTPTGTSSAAPHKTPSSEVPRTPPKTTADKKPTATPRSVPVTVKTPPAKTTDTKTATDSSSNTSLASPSVRKPLPATPRSSPVAAHQSRAAPPSARASPLSVSHTQSKEATAVGQSSRKESNKTNSTPGVETKNATVSSPSTGDKPAATVKKVGVSTEAKRATPSTKLATTTPSVPRTPRAAPAATPSNTIASSARTGTDRGETTARTTTAATTPRTARPTPPSISKLTTPSTTNTTKKPTLPRTPSVTRDTSKKPAVPATPRSTTTTKTNAITTINTGANGTADKTKPAVKKPAAVASRTSSTTNTGKNGTVKVDTAAKKEEEGVVVSTLGESHNGLPELQESRNHAGSDSIPAGNAVQAQNVDTGNQDELLTLETERQLLQACALHTS